MGGLKHSQKVGLFFGFPHYAYVRSLFPKTGCRPDPEEFGWVRLTKDILLDQGTPQHWSIFNQQPSQFLSMILSRTAPIGPICNPRKIHVFGEIRENPRKIHVFGEIRENPRKIHVFGEIPTFFVGSTHMFSWWNCYICRALLLGMRLHPTPRQTGAIFREIMGFHGFSIWFSWDFMGFNVDFTWISCGKHGRNHGESLMIMDT